MTMLSAAIACLEWATPTHPEDGDDYRGYLETSDAEWHPDAIAELSADLDSFVAANAGDLLGLDADQVGHDFILTANHHGAGFWDRGLGDRGDRLTAAAHAYSYDPYIGDDGMIHL